MRRQLLPTLLATAIVLACLSQGSARADVPALGEMCVTDEGVEFRCLGSVPSAGSSAPYTGPTLGDVFRKLFPKRTAEEIARARSAKAEARSIRQEAKAERDLAEALVAVDRGDFKKAVQKIRSYLTVWHGGTSIWAEIAERVRKAKGIDGEIAFWQAALHNCKTTCAEFQAALENTEKRRVRQARRALQQALVNRAYALLKRGQYREAIPLLEELMRQSPAFTWGWKALARAYFGTINEKGWVFSLADLDRLIQAERRVSTLDPNNPDNLKYLIRSYRLKGNHAATLVTPNRDPIYVKLALDAYGEIVSVAPDDPELRIEYGKVAADIGAYEESISMLKAALRINKRNGNHIGSPEHVYADVMLRWSLSIESVDKEKAKDLLARATHMQPFHPYVWRHYVRILDTDAEYQAAERKLRDLLRRGAIQLDMPYMRAIDRTSRIGLDDGQVGARLGRVKEAVKAVPAQPDNWDKLGMAYLRAGFDHEAAAAFDRSDEIGRGMGVQNWDLAKFLVDRAVAAEATGEFESAAGLYREAVEEDPENIFAWNELGNVMHRLGQTEGARSAKQTVLDLLTIDAAASAVHHGEQAVAATRLEMAKSESARVFDDLGLRVPARAEIPAVMQSSDLLVGFFFDEEQQARVAEMDVPESVKKDPRLGRLRWRLQLLDELNQAVEERVEKLHQQRDAGTGDQGELDLKFVEARQDADVNNATRSALELQIERVIDFHLEIEVEPNQEVAPE